MKLFIERQGVVQGVRSRKNLPELRRRLFRGYSDCRQNP